MLTTLVRIETEVPLTIFDEPSSKEQVNQLFDGSEEKIKARVDEIVKFLRAESAKELSYSNIRVLFERYFYEFILNEAVKVSLTEKEKYNILSNILSLLTVENLEAAIMGKPMINAFTRAIRSMPDTDSLVSPRRRGNMIYLLNHHFV